jgi:hypothetical protein
VTVLDSVFDLGKWFMNLIHCKDFVWAVLVMCPRLAISFANPSFCCDFFQGSAETSWYGMNVVEQARP